jgi:hypothetical protein
MMAERKRTTTKTTAKKTTAKGAKVQTTSGTTGVVRVPAGGIDPRLVEERERLREAEKDVRVASHSEPATLDPKLAEIREATKKREAELANRSVRKTPARG